MTLPMSVPQGVTAVRELLPPTREKSVPPAFSWQECARRGDAAGEGSLQVGAAGEVSGGSPGFAEPGSSQGHLGKRWHLCPLQSPGLKAGWHQAEFSR